MYTFYLTQTLGCTVEEAAELEFEPIILFNKLNIAIGSFYNETEEPYVVVYNSIYTDPDEIDTPTKIIRISLIRNNIIHRYSALTEFTPNEITDILKIIVDNWDFIRELYMYTYINKFGKCVYIPKECPYKNDKYVTSIDTDNKLRKWGD